jgi:hypothetical protein
MKRIQPLTLATRMAIFALSTIPLLAFRAPSTHRATHHTTARTSDPDEKGGLASLASVSTLTITRVKKPWYAWRGLVVKGMEKSIPEYGAIDGLSEKFYTFTEKHDRFGGIYLWQNEQDAQNWFNPGWFDRTEKKYGQKGQVDYFRITEVTILAATDMDPAAGSKKESWRTGKSWAVLSYPAGGDPDLGHGLADSRPAGLLKIVALTDARQQMCFLTLWQDKPSAMACFKAYKGKNEYFDTPILLTNAKPAL